MAYSTPGNALGNEAANLYRDHAVWLFGWLRRRLGGNNTDAADLVQDTYVRLMDSGRYPPIGEGRAFLAQIAKGLVLDLQRRRRLEFAYLEALASQPQAEFPSAEQQHQVLEVLIRIDRMLDQLPAKVSQTFLLSRFEGLTYPQIADRLEISYGSVRKYMLRATQVCLLAMDE